MPQAKSLQKFFDLAKDFIAIHAQSDSQKDLLSTALQRLHKQVAHEEFLPFISLAPLVYSAIQGEEEQALPLAVATTFLYLGIDLLDDIADKDIPAIWKRNRPEEIQLAAATFISSLPQLAIAEFKAPLRLLLKWKKPWRKASCA